VSLYTPGQTPTVRRTIHDEHILATHSICSTRRELFSWLAALFTFALGAAAGDLAAEKLDLGDWKSVLLFAEIIGVAALAHVSLKLGSVLTFWIVSVLTRLLGASIGDVLSQDKDTGSLALGTLRTSALFLVAILGAVLYLSATARHQSA